MARRPATVVAPPHAVLTAASILPGRPLPAWAVVGESDDRRTWYPPPPAADPERHDDAGVRGHSELVRARVVARAPAGHGDSGALTRAATAEVGLPGHRMPETGAADRDPSMSLLPDGSGADSGSPPPAPTVPPVIAPPAGPRHRAPETRTTHHAAPPPSTSERQGRWATALLILIVVGVIGFGFALLVVPSLLGTGATGRDKGGASTTRAVSLGARSDGYRAATGTGALAAAAGLGAQLGRLGVAEPVAVTYMKPGHPSQTVAVGALARPTARSQQEFLAAWRRAVDPRAVMSAPGLPRGTVGTCGAMVLRGVPGTGCAFAGSELSGLLWLPRTSVSVAARALPTALAAVRTGAAARPSAP